MENPVKMFKLLHTEFFRQTLNLCDAKLQTEDGFAFDVHRVHLARSSNYFLTMFCGIQNQNRREFTIPGISGECLGEILYFMYTNNVSVTENNVTELLVASDYLLLKDLYQIVKASFKSCLTAVNSLRLFNAAEKINDACTSMASFRFIQTRFEQIVQCRGNGLADLPIDVFHKILSNKSICIKSEFTVWQVIVEWIQEDVNERLMYTPHLLTLLARKEIDEDLASTVLHHTIIDRNPFVGRLNEIRNSSKFNCNLEILQNFLENYEGMDYRIPPELHVVALRDIETESSTVYLTYDDNMDFWRKVVEDSFYVEDVIAIGHNIFVFGEEDSLKFDLSTQQCFPLRNFRNSIRNFSVVNVDNMLYVLGEIIFNNNSWNYGFDVYYPDTDIWFGDTCPTNVSNAVAVAISKKIYVLGYTPNFSEMVAQVFDVETWQWSRLPPPNIYRREFWMVALREYLYLIGGSNVRNDNTTKVEIFDKSANMWIRIADIGHVYPDIEAVVWKGQVVVFGSSEDWFKSERTVCWSEERNIWEAFDKSTRIDLRSNLFCTILDAHSIRVVTKRNRNINNEFYIRLFL